MTLLTLVCGLALAGPPGQVHPEQADWGWSSEQSSTVEEPDTGLVVADAPADLAAGSDPLYERLLGDDSAPEGGPTTLSSARLSGVPWWLLGAAGLGGIALWLSRKRTSLLTREPPHTTLKVACRTSLGATSGVAVVELTDDGWTRRFLVGTGGGAPTLVAELDVRAPQAAISADPPPLRDHLPEPGEALQIAGPAFAARYAEIADALQIEPDEVEERRVRAQGLIREAIANRRAS